MLTPTQLFEQIRNTKVSSSELRTADASQRNLVLQLIADGILNNKAAILEANQRDTTAAKNVKLTDAIVDRLTLNSARLDAIASAVRDISALPDPLGHIDNLRQLPSGIRVGQMSMPIGLIAVVYEARPNVTIDVAALCIKSGNGAVLRGGREAFESNMALYGIVREALRTASLSPNAVFLVPPGDRSEIGQIAQMKGTVDLIIPRGGSALVEHVREVAKIPVIEHAAGNCHIFVDESANVEMAVAIITNAKTQRPGVCNAVETVLVHHAIAHTFLPALATRLLGEVELRGDDFARRIVPELRPATSEDWNTEYLDLILAVKVVEDIDSAITHIEEYGSHHTEVIVTESYANSQRWVKEVDASLVGVNLSTRFNDGFELGLGAEMGISTSRLHVYGPMGLSELCIRKWVAFGDGQIRR